jgi:hypothetical protein
MDFSILEHTVVKPRSIAEYAPSLSSTSLQKWARAVRDGSLIESADDAQSFAVGAFARSHSGNGTASYPVAVTADRSVIWTWPTLDNPAIQIKTDWPFSSVCVTFNLHNDKEKGVANPQFVVFLVSEMGRKSRDGLKKSAFTSIEKHSKTTAKQVESDYEAAWQRVKDAASPQRQEELSAQIVAEAQAKSMRGVVSEIVRAMRDGA